MKKIILLLAMAAGSFATYQISAGESSAATQTCTTQSVETYNVVAVKNPSAGVKIKAYFTVEWDGNEAWVVARDGKPIPRVKATYSTKYQGYPYCFSIDRQTWYFAL